MTGIEQLPALAASAERAFAAIAASSLIGQHSEVTSVQFRALTVLDGQESVRVADLADSCGIDRSTATRLCDRLVRKGLITRTRGNDDRRAVRVALTEHGQNFLESVSNRRLAKIQRIMEVIPESSRAQIAEALDILNRAATYALTREDHVF